MDKETVREQLRDYAEMTERAIDSYLPETECLQKNVILAARHSLDRRRKAPQTRARDGVLPGQRRGSGVGASRWRAPLR